MSRIARKPIAIPKGVELRLAGSELSIKGQYGEVVHLLPDSVQVELDGQTLRVFAKQGQSPMLGTTFKLLQNKILGVFQKFECRLQLVGVGYRAKVQGQQLELSLGFSNPVFFNIPVGVSVATPAQNEIVLQAIDNQLLGETAAQICQFRPTESYKGKGVRLMLKNPISGLWAPMVVVLKQAKKKK